MPLRWNAGNTGSVLEVLETGTPLYRGVPLQTRGASGRGRKQHQRAKTACLPRFCEYPQPDSNR